MNIMIATFVAPVLLVIFQDIPLVVIIIDSSRGDYENSNPCLHHIPNRHAVFLQAG